ncbi:MAG: SMC family ATPase, partial [Thaumarchaeota archaeon]|nr:SMC family ATPase [Nitrososphaerota archaeon]
MSQQTSSGFIINGLELGGFMRYDVPTPIPFKQKFMVITGPTGSGKTSILDSITYALYGRSSRTDEKMKIEEFVSDDGYVQLDFAQDGQDYRVVRGRKNGRNYLIFSHGTQRISGSATELEQRIVNLVGLDYTGFTNSTFIRQDEMQQLGSETGAGRLDIFERLFRLEIFERAQELADTKLRAVESEMAAGQEELREKREQYDVTLPDERKKLREATSTYNSVKKTLDDLETKIKDCKDSVTRLEPAHKNYDKSVQRISEISQEVERTNSELKEAEAKNEERFELGEKSGKLKGAPEEEKELIERINELEKVQDKVSNLLKMKQIHQRAIERIKKETTDEISEVKTEEEEQRNRLKKFAEAMTKEEALDLLRLDGALRERLERIGKEIEWLKDFSPQLVESLKSEGKKTNLRSSKVTSQVKKIGSEPFVRGEIETNLTKLSERIRKISEKSKGKIQHEQKELDPLVEELRKIHFDDEDLA